MLFKFKSSKLKKIIKFIETCHTITANNDGYISMPINLFKHQIKYISDLNKYKKLIVLKSKQIGETLASLCNILYIVNYKKNSTVLIISTNDTDLQEKRLKLINLFSVSELPYRYDYENIIDCGNNSQIMFLTLDKFFQLNSRFNQIQNNENTFIYFLDIDFKMEILSSIFSILNKLDNTSIVITIDNRKSIISQSIYNYVSTMAKKYKMKLHSMNQYKVVVKKLKK